MKHNYCWLLSCIVLSNVGSCPLAYAAENFSKRVFDVTYKTTNPVVGDNTARLVCDGKGHLRSEMQSPWGGNTVTIFDYLDEKEFTLTEKTHTYKTEPFHPAPDKAGVSNKPAGKPIGTKVVAGHPCHGYEITSQYGACQSWMGDDIHYLVQSETPLPNGKMVQTIQSWSTATPTPDLFKIPPDYKQVETAK